MDKKHKAEMAPKAKGKKMKHMMPEQHKRMSNFVKKHS